MVTYGDLPLQGKIPMAETRIYIYTYTHQKLHIQYVQLLLYTINYNHNAWNELY
jgi:hypothetical protein